MYLRLEILSLSGNVQVKVFGAHAIGAVEVRIHVFLISALDCGESLSVVNVIIK